MSAITVQCPTCSKPVTWTATFPDRPFCSERCRLIDLGAWSDESYRIPAQTSPEDWSEESLSQLEQQLEEQLEEHTSSQ